MRYLTHISKTCESDAKKHGLWAEVQKLAKRIEEQQITDNLDTHGQFLKKPMGKNFRLLIGKKHHGDDCLLLFWHVFLRSGAEYRRFCENTSYFDNKFDQDSRTESLSTVWEQKKIRPDLSRFIDLSQEERIYLYLPNTQKTGDWLILESEEWVRSTEKKSGKYSSYLALLHPIILGLIEEPCQEQQSFSGNVGVLYRCLPEQKILYLVSPIQADRPDDIASIRQRYNKELEGVADEEMLLRKSKRSYPELILYETDLWIRAIQETNEKANLALSKEEAEILRSNEPNYPLFINGRPGSGKSTILQYLFAEHLYHHLVIENAPGTPLYLTYNRELLDVASENVLRILTSNSNKLTGNRTIQQQEAEAAVSHSFVDFREYLYSLLPTQKHLNKRKYIGFPEFRLQFEKRFSKYPDPSIRKVSAELAWHVIRTYIKGVVAEENEYLDPDGFRELPSRPQKSITDATYDIVYDIVWSGWYREFCEREGYWDDQDLARTLLMLSSAQPDDFSFAKHSAIFCDEAQDFTRNELRMIFQLSLFSRRNLTPDVLKRIPFAFAGDPFQTLNPTGFDWKSTRTTLYQTIVAHLDKRQKPTLAFNFKELSFNYRSTRNIVQLCNFIHLMRGIAFSKEELLPQQTWFDDAANMPVYFDVDNPVLRTKMQEQQEIVIIVPCQEGEELSYVQKDDFLKTFALSDDEKQITRNVLSAMRAKGQEFSRVVIYKFGDACRTDYPELLDLIEPGHTMPELSQEKIIPLEYFVNRLYVAASRAEKRLFIADTAAGLAEFWKFFEMYDPDIFIDRYRKSVEQPGSDIPFMWAGNDLVKIQLGDQDSWEKDHDDPSQLAEEFFKSGRRLKDAYKLRLAIQNYHAAGKYDRKLECEGRLYELIGENEKAGECFERLGDRQTALEFYWKAEAFAKIVRFGENSLENEAAAFMLYQDEKSLSDGRWLLGELAAAIKGERVHPDEVWAKVIGTIIKNILAKTPESALDLYEWGNIQKAAKEFSKQGLFPKSEERMLGLLRARATAYPEKLEILEKINADARQIANYFYENRQSPLTEIQQDILHQALHKLNKYDEMENLLDLYPSLKRYAVLLALYLREAYLQTQVEPFGQKIFLYLTSQGLWETALDFASKAILPVDEAHAEPIRKHSWNYLLDTLFIRALAVSEALPKASKGTKHEVSKYLSYKLLEQASAFYRYLTVPQAGAALERANRIRDCLEFYESVFDRQTWPATDQMIKFAKERWLICKTRQIDLHKADADKQRIRREIRSKQEEWHIDDIAHLPEYPVVDWDQKPEPVKSKEKKRKVPKPDPIPENAGSSPRLPSWLGEVPPDPKSSAPRSIPESTSDPHASIPPQLQLSINLNGHMYRCSIVRERGKLHIHYGTQQEMITLTAKGLKAHGSDDDLQDHIQEHVRTEHMARYFIPLWELTCVLRQQEDFVYVDLILGKQLEEAITLRLA